MMQIRANNLLLLIMLTLVLTSLYSILTGPIALNWKQLLGLTPLDHTEALVLTHIRLPRTLLCLAVGASLAVSGAVMQGLFRNPLADPGIIGVSSGAAVGAAIALVLLTPLTLSLPQWFSLGLTSFMAFLGALAAALIVYQLAKTPWGTSVSILLLAGVAITALSGSLLGLMNYLADDQALRDLALWQMGSLAQTNHTLVMIVCSVSVICSILLYCKASHLNALALGESEAGHLGIEVNPLKRQLLLLSTITVGVSVSAVGIIGFIGLVVPHLVRLLTGPDHRTLLPLSAIVGAWLLLMADMLARTLAAPAEMPVGIITALIGAPFFIGLLLKQRKGAGLL
ncbi:FecCD family ABC transporter permease [Nitrincola sp. MINF-07-Sa-05]|uniref:FecCD family ABC transporter permease n=1 Tax=Nitrincola salilacus TaxID=3400273 RepID=UPI0039181C2A